MDITAPWMIKEESSYKYCSHNTNTQTTITFFNNNLDSYTTNSYELAGGTNEKCNILEEIGQQSIDFLQRNGITMEEYLDVILKKVNRIDFRSCL